MPTDRPPLPLVPPGHGLSARPAVIGRPLGRSPFGAAAPSILAALAYLVALFVWLAVGDRLPGGRWFAVHLFTLGVLTNLILTFSEHFARTLTRTPGERAAWWPLVTNAGILAVLTGRAAGDRWSLAAGSVVVTTAVTAAYLRMRRMRRAAIGPRFGWVVRLYERAHGAFIHGAFLGVLMGIGVLNGAWYGGVRLAHLHANVLGWGGLTLLATLVFFGPSMARTRIEDGADAQAARALRFAAAGLSVAVLALIPVGLGGVLGAVTRTVATAGLVLYAVAATVVCLPVARAVHRARPSAPRPLVIGVCVCLPAAAWADAVVVAAGAWRWLDAVGVAALAGVLGQAVLATLTYLAPMLRGRSTTAREAIRARLDVGGRVRAVVFATGLALVVVGSLGVTEAVPAAGAGWMLIALVIATTVLTVAWPTVDAVDAGR